MNLKDLDSKTLQLIEDFAYIIEGGLGYSWKVSMNCMGATEAKNIEWLKAQLTLFLMNCNNKEENG
jgi:hypothetical protein